MGDLFDDILQQAAQTEARKYRQVETVQTSPPQAQSHRNANGQPAQWQKSAKLVVKNLSYEELMAAAKRNAEKPVTVQAPPITKERKSLTAPPRPMLTIGSTSTATVNRRHTVGPPSKTKRTSQIVRKQQTQLTGGAPIVALNTAKRDLRTIEEIQQEMRERKLQQSQPSIRSPTAARKREMAMSASSASSMKNQQVLNAAAVGRNGRVLPPSEVVEQPSTVKKQNIKQTTTTKKVASGATGRNGIALPPADMELNNDEPVTLQTKKKKKRKVKEREEVSAAIQSLFPSRRSTVATQQQQQQQQYSDDYSDDSSADMEATVGDMMREERRSAAIARREDELELQRQERLQSKKRQKCIEK